MLINWTTWEKKKKKKKRSTYEEERGVNSSDWQAAGFLMDL